CALAAQEVAQLVVLQGQIQHPQHVPPQPHPEHTQAGGEQEPGRGAAPCAAPQRDGAAGQPRRTVPPVLVGQGLAHSEKKPSISAAAASAASWTGVPPRMSPSRVLIVFAPSILPHAGVTGTGRPPSTICVAKTSVSSSPPATTSSTASVVPGK